MSLTSTTPTPAETTFYGQDVEVMTPTSYDELAQVLEEQRGRGRCVIPSGLGAHAYLGNPVEDSAVVLSLREMRSILRYEPGDFTVGAQAGVSLNELSAELSSNGQEIPIDIPSGNGKSFTLGGAVAANLFGPRSGFYGSLRNYTIGAVGMRGDGSIYKTGGMVVKNVAGYDIAKLLVGSLGTLGIILEVNFKLRPVRQYQVGGLVSFSVPSEAWDFVRLLRERHLDPVTLSVLGPETTRALLSTIDAGDDEAWSVMWSFEGNQGAVSALSTRLDGLLDEVPSGARWALDDGRLPAALDFLVGLQIPEAVESTDLLILRLSALPSGVERLSERVQDTVEAHARLESLVAHGSTGVLVVRVRGEAEGLVNCLREISRVLPDTDAKGRVLFASNECKMKHDFLLRPDPNPKIARAILGVYDPYAFFHSNRVSRTT